MGGRNGRAGWEGGTGGPDGREERKGWDGREEREWREDWMDRNGRDGNGRDGNGRNGNGCDRNGGCRLTDNKSHFFYIGLQVLSLKHLLKEKVVFLLIINQIKLIKALYSLYIVFIAEPIINQKNYILTL